MEFHALADTGEALTPETARDQLQNQAPVQELKTRLAETPFWVSFRAPSVKSGVAEPSAIEFPSRHTAAVTCWNGETLQALGSASHAAQQGQLAAIKAGFALTLPAQDRETPILCKLTHVGPAYVTLKSLAQSDLNISASEFHRNSGLMAGGMIMMALFMLITAIINRDGQYLLFSAWLLVSLRMGAISAGWDFQWVGHLIPPEWLIRSRQITTALYYVLTFTLFKTLFQKELSKFARGSYLQVAQWLSLPLLLAAMLLPYRHYLPLLWVATAYSIAVLVFNLGRILLQRRSDKTANWYALSLSVTLFASLYEVVAAAIGQRELIGSLNSVSAALVSGLLASLAVAERMRNERLELKEAQTDLRNAYEAMPIGLFSLDMDGRFTRANPALIRMLSGQPAAVHGQDWAQYFEPQAWPRLHHLINTHKTAELELRGVSDQPEEIRRYLVRATVSRDRIEGSLQDITENHKAAENLNFLAYHDPLTKLLNRNGLKGAYSEAVAQVPHQRPLAMAYLDLDRFKLINDLYGHAEGDAVLKQICQRLQRVVPPGSKIGRVGGDEFVILLPDTPISLASVISQSLVNAIASEPYQREEKSFHIRGSIGLIDVREGSAFKDAMSTADRACRAAKVRGKGLVVFDSQSSAYVEHKAELQLVERLLESSNLPGLFLEMQPIMSLGQPHDSLNFEVLLRMQDPDGKRVPVGSLISAGELSGCMGDIDRWVLSTTLNWLNENLAHLQTTRFVCVNFSGASLNDETFLDDVFDLLDQNRHVAHLLCLEITESVALNDMINTSRFIDRVRGYGAKVALDDFGAGYTSFSYLKELPADVLKVDGSLVVNINQHPANVSIVEAIVSLARNLGMKTIAEWAEDQAAVETLVEIGVDYVQGFAVARPQAPEALLTAHSSASFIKDPGLANFVLHLGDDDTRRTQADLFGPTDPRQVH